MTGIQAPDGITYCLRHPNVESNLRCSRCNDLICPRCLVQTPVGARCPDCARLRVNPAFAVDSGVIVKAAAGAVVASVLAWALYFYVLIQSGGLGFLLGIFAPLGIGYAVAEVTYRAAGYRRHPRLQWVAAGAVLAGFVIGFALIGALPSNLVRGIIQAITQFALAILIAIGVAVYRSRNI